MTLIDIFRDSFKRFSNKTVFEYPFKSGDSIEWRSMTYDDLWRLSLRIAQLINEKGICAGDRVILFAENSPWWCASYIGIILNGAVAVPVDVEIDDESFKNIIKDSTASLIISSTRTADRLKGYDYFICDNVEIPSMIEDRFNPHVDSESIVSIIYTSGTTGLPKGVMLTHGNFVFEIKAIEKTAIINEYENVLCMLPLHHTYPFVCNFIAPVAVGARVTFTPSLKGEEIIKTIREKKITVFVTVPQVLELMEKRIIERLRSLPFIVGIPLSFFRKLFSFLRRRFDINLGRLFFFFIHLRTGFQLRFLASGGAKLNPEVMESLEAVGFTILEGYGLTETSPIVTFNPPHRRKPGSAGKALEGVDIRIYEPQSDGTGEIIVRGPCVMKGYYKNDVLTYDVIKNGWLHTGDIGYLDEYGYLYITGRKKEVIVLPSGKNIYPEELEERYKRSIPLIKDICILDDMSALIIPDIEYARSKELINIEASLKWEIDRVSSTLPSYMRLRGFRLYHKPFPKTRLGKLRRFLIREMIKKPEIEEASRLPEGEIYRRIEGLFMRILPERKSINLNSHLEIDLGLDSLGRLELASGVEKEFGIHVSEDMLKSWHTVEDIVRDIEHPSSIPGSQEKKRGLIFSFIKIIILSAGYISLRLFFKLFYRLEVKGIENITRSPFILISNHASYLDGFVIFSSLPFRISRNLHFHGLKRYFPSQFLSDLLNVIRISSEGEYIEAMKRTSRIIRMGYPLCIFPEAGRSFDGRLRELKSGFAMIALKHNIPVIPVYISGTFRALPRGRIIPRPSKIRIFITRPIDVSGLKSLFELLNEVNSVFHLMEDRYLSL